MTCLALPDEMNVQLVPASPGRSTIGTVTTEADAMFTPATTRQIAAVALKAAIEPATLCAVVEVESGGRVTARISGRDEPLIRFEAHYFDRRLGGAKRDRARAEGLASPKAGAIANPATQAARWRLLSRAAAIDRKAAHESVSWGVGQVMGAHWAWLGYPDVDTFVDTARRDLAGQLEIMLRYIEKSGLVAALNRRDWVAFARAYNGPAYARNRYDRKLAAAHARHVVAGQTENGDEPPTGDVLRSGARGEPVRDLQLALRALGYPVAADGVFGADTAAAVKKFQADRNLAVDGIAGRVTMAALESGLKPAIGLCGGIVSLAGRLLAWLRTRA